MYQLKTQCKKHPTPNRHTSSSLWECHIIFVMISRMPQYNIYKCPVHFYIADCKIWGLLGFLGTLLLRWHCVSNYVPKALWPWGQVAFQIHRSQSNWVVKVLAVLWWVVRKSGWSGWDFTVPLKVRATTNSMPPYIWTKLQTDTKRIFMNCHWCTVTWHQL